jgi:uncharacterized zinc-type alcohol dehydrogenase-like protein
MVWTQQRRRLLCPGVAAYGPLKRFNFTPGDKIGIVGIGGPGHIAVMLANAMEAEVTAITTHEAKRETALRMGARDVIVSTAMGLLGPYGGVLNNLSLAAQGLSLTGSMIGNIADSQEVLDFCAEHGILSWVEVIKIQDVNDAIRRLKKADVRFRFVIDMSSLLSTTLVGLERPINE